MIIKNTREVLNRENPPKEIVISFGAAHSYGIETYLFESAFRHLNTEWIKSISGDRYKNLKGI